MAGTHKTTRRLALTAAALALTAAACIDLNIPSGDSLFPERSFIIGGTMDLDRQRQACSIFQADNGLGYRLFQGPRLTNDEYDQLFEDGAGARLEIEVRDELSLVGCDAAAVTVEVVEVLEFIPS
ncbi:MAG: hypothetical protein IID40_00505 [Planctomycetes bacterium]|nr:hypothetical protein [Planctomycetota bacterium]